MIVNAAPSHHRQAGALSDALEQSVLLPAWGVHICLENTVIFLLLPVILFASLVLLHLFISSIWASLLQRDVTRPASVKEVSELACLLVSNNSNYYTTSFCTTEFGFMSYVAVNYFTFVLPFPLNRASLRAGMCLYHTTFSLTSKHCAWHVMGTMWREGSEKGDGRQKPKQTGWHESLSSLDGSSWYNSS